MKIKILSHNYTGNSLVVAAIVDGQVRTRIVESTHPNWPQVFTLYQNGQIEELVPLMDMDEAIATKFRGNFTVKNNKVCYKGNPIHGYLVDRIVFFMRELPNQVERLLAFAENLYQNSDPRVIEQLYKFLEHKYMPITDDGCFLAYKGVGADYFSKTAGNIKVIRGKVKDKRIWNGVGARIIVDRLSVCSDPNQGCSSGLHVGSWDYANDFKGDGRLMVVKVNPKHVCSVPTDCSYQKCRVCEYKVIAEEGRKLSEVKDCNFDRVAEQRFHRDSLGRICRVIKLDVQVTNLSPKASKEQVNKYCRDKFGRFASKE